MRHRPIRASRCPRGARGLGPQRNRLSALGDGTATRPNPLHEILHPAEVAAPLAGISRLVREALPLVPRLLGEPQARLQRLHPEPLRRGLTEPDFPPVGVGSAGRSERLE